MMTVRILQHRRIWDNRSVADKGENRLRLRHSSRVALWYGAGFALALTLTMLVRIPFLRCEPLVPGAPYFLDEPDYIRLARALPIGDRSVDIARPWVRAPVTSLVLIGLARLRDLPPEFVTCDFQIFQVAVWAALVVMMAAVAGLLFGPRVSLITAFLAAALPDGVGVTLLVHSDALFCFELALTAGLLLVFSRRPHPGWLIAAGITAGVGALTRSPMLVLMPVLLAWAAFAVWQYWRGKPRPAGAEGFWTRWRAMARVFVHDVRYRPAALLHELKRPALAAGLFLLCFVAVIAPWTIRNYLVHGGLIISDTVGAVNLLNDNSPTRHTTYSAIMASSDNPVERQRFANQQAWAAIRAAPLRFVAKFVRDSVWAWGPGRFDESWNFWQAALKQPRLGSLFAQLDALLYMAVPLALLGLLFAPRAAAGAAAYRGAVFGLAGCYTIMVGMTHFEARYRTPFLLLLLPFAAWTIAHPRVVAARLRRPSGWLLLLVLASSLVAYLPAWWPAQWNNARALALHGRGIARAAWGDVPGALADQRLAWELQPGLREARLAEAALLAKQGDLEGAEAALGTLLPGGADGDERISPGVAVALQRLLLQQGRVEEAAALEERLSLADLHRAEALLWREGAQPAPRLQLGVGDLGLIEGFYRSEGSETGTMRWSRPHARLLLAGRGDHICLRVNAARPSDVPAPAVSISAGLDGQAPVFLRDVHPPRQGWAWLCAALPAAPRGDATQVEVVLRTFRYIPYVEKQDSDSRELGVAVAEAVLREGPLSLDPDTGLLLDRAAPPRSVRERQSTGWAGVLLGVSGDLHVQRGSMLQLTLWWRCPEPPPPGAFTFIHLVDEAGAQVAAYNAPTAAGQLPLPWRATEPLADQAAIPLPAELAAGSYYLVAGAFDPASGQEWSRVDLGEVVVE